MNLNCWADGAWADGSMLESAWGVTASTGRVAPPTGAGVTNRLYWEFEEWLEKRRLERELAEKLKALKAVEKKKELVEQKAVQEIPPKGILANLHKLEVREQKLVTRIETIQVRLEELDMILQALVAKKILDDDEDDFEVLML